MPVQFPTLTTQEAVEREHRIATQTLYPYTYSYFLTINPTNFPQSGGLALKYFTAGLQAEDNMAIADVSVQASSIFFPSAGGLPKATQTIEISYSPILNEHVSAAVVATPTDSGNIVYRNESQFILNTNASGAGGYTVDIDDYHRFAPYDYVLKFNQIVYIHVGISPNVVQFDPAGKIALNVIFHMLRSGQKS